MGNYAEHINVAIITIIRASCSDIIMIIIRFIVNSIYCTMYHWPISVFKYIIYTIIAVYNFPYR